MGYLFFIIAFLLIVYAFYERNKLSKIKKKGIKLTGVILSNYETNANDSMRLGGNINTPTIQYFTVEGQEMIGQPVVGFISQQEIVEGNSIDIICDPDDPKRFTVDF
jgi:hypothetical protein